MRIRIDYTSYRLSAGVESIVWTERAEWFFRDHNLDYKIVKIDFYNESGVKCIEWNEELIVNIPLYTLPVLQSYTKLYNCKITIEQDLCTIRFNEV